MWRCWLFIINTLRPRQNGRHFPDDIFKWVFLNENVWILINISLKFVPRGPINNIPTLVQVMAWRRPGNKPLSEPMIVRLPTHICVTRPQWVSIHLRAKSGEMFKNYPSHELEMTNLRLQQQLLGTNELIKNRTWIINQIHIFIWDVIHDLCHNLNGSLTHWGRDKMAAFSQTTLSNAFSWMKILEFRLKIHLSLFLMVLLTIFQHWFW